MKIEWLFDAEDVALVRTLVQSQANHHLLKWRRDKNLADVKPPVTKDRFWKAMVCMRLTSRQRSGPGKPVGWFIAREPFPLTYSAVLKAKSVQELVTRSLSSAGGILDYNIIAAQLAENFKLLECGEWSEALSSCNRLTRPVSREDEVKVADYIDERFSGFGPKQARNFLQSLGLTRYEIPIDSRATKWLNANNFPVKLSAGALADKNYYRFILDGVQVLCERADVLPCLFDAAIFSVADSSDYSQDPLGF